MLPSRIVILLVVVCIAIIHIAGAEDLCSGVRVELTKNTITVLAYDCPITLSDSKDMILEADKNGDGVIAMWEVEQFQKEILSKYGQQEVTDLVYVDGKSVSLKMSQLSFQNLYQAKVGEDRQLYVITTLTGSYALSGGTHTVKVALKAENTYIDFMIPGVAIKESNGQRGTFNNYPEVKTSQKSGYLMAVFEVPAQKSASVENEKESAGGFEAVLGLVAIGSAVLIFRKR